MSIQCVCGAGGGGEMGEGVAGVVGGNSQF